MTRDVLDLLRLLDPEVDPDRVVHLEDPPPPDHPELRAILDGARSRRNGQPPHPPTPDHGGGPIMATQTRPELDGRTSTGRSRLGWLATAAAAIGAIALVVSALPGNDPALPAAPPTGEHTEAVLPTVVVEDDGCAVTGPLAVAAAPDERVLLPIRNASSVGAYVMLTSATSLADARAIAATVPAWTAGEPLGPDRPDGIVVEQYLLSGNVNAMPLRGLAPGPHFFACMHGDGSGVTVAPTPVHFRTADAAGPPAPVGPGDEPWMVFTGEACATGGPTSITPVAGTLVDVHVRNDSPVTLKAALLETSADADLDAVAATYPVIREGDPIPGAPADTQQAITVEPGETSVLRFLAPAVDTVLLGVCVPFDGRPPFHTGAPITFEP